MHQNLPKVFQSLSRVQTAGLQPSCKHSTAAPAGCLGWHPVNSSRWGVAALCTAWYPNPMFQLHFVGSACIPSDSSFRHAMLCPCACQAGPLHSGSNLCQLAATSCCCDHVEGTGTGAGTNSQRQQQQQQQTQPQQRPQRHQPTPAFSPGGVFRNTGSSSDHPVGSLGQMLNQVTAAIPAAAGSNGSSGNNAQSPVVALPGSLATHKDNIARLRTSMWVYLTPLLGMLYILSPLDIIPDFIPLVGWIDDGENCPCHKEVLHCQSSWHFREAW